VVACPPSFKQGLDSSAAREAVKQQVDKCHSDEKCWAEVSQLQGFFLELHASSETRCFPAGALVSTASGGSIPVEDLKRGTVLASPKFSEGDASHVKKDYLGDYHLFDGFPDTITLEYVEISHEVSE